MSIQLTTNLKDFQIHTIKWMNKQEKNYNGGLLLNEPGLGKSICVLSTIVHNPLKTLIICPSSLIDNWINEIQKHTNIKMSDIVKYHGSNRHKIKIHSQFIFITSYSIVSREFEKTTFQKNSLFKKIHFERIVLDEAHYIRNNNTNVSNSVLFFTNYNCKKWIVTATPIFNKADDAYPYFKFLGIEGIDSKNEWNKFITKNISGLHKLNSWITKYGISLKKDDVLKELKEKNIIKYEINFDTTEQLFYNALKEYSILRINKLIERIKNLKKSENSMRAKLYSIVLVYILRLRQACNSPWLVLQSMERLKTCENINESITRLKFFDDPKNVNQECPICMDNNADWTAEPCGHKCCKICWNKIKNSKCPICRTNITDVYNEINEKTKEKNNVKLKTSSKIIKLIEIIKNVLNKNEKIVIVSQWVNMLSLIREIVENEINVKSIILKGNISFKERSNSIRSFENNDDVKICYVSLNASAEGINLISANHLVLMDLWWNNAKMTQVTDRIHRIGQCKSVNIYNLQIKESIEQKIENMIEKKCKISNLIQNKWNINNLSKYDDSWIRTIERLLD